MLPLSAAYAVRLLGLVAPSTFALAAACLFALDLCVCALAYALDGGVSRDLIHAPLQRFLFPFFLLGVLATICARRLRGQPARWISARESSRSAAPPLAAESGRSS